MNGFTFACDGVYKTLTAAVISFQRSAALSTLLAVSTAIAIKNFC